MQIPPPIKRRSGAFISRIVTSLLALALSNATFHLWQNSFIPTFGLSLNILAYVAQAIGSSVGVCLDYHGHAHVYRPTTIQKRTLSQQVGFYMWRIRFLPVGLGAFILTYEWLGFNYVLSSCLAAVPGWLVSYRQIENHFLKDEI
jgi:hypothetical protein